MGWRGAGDDCGFGLTDGGGVGVVILYGVNSFATVLANCECPCSIFQLPLQRLPLAYPMHQFPPPNPHSTPIMPSSFPLSPRSLTPLSFPLPIPQPDTQTPLKKTFTNALQPRNTKTTLETPQPRHRSLRISDRMV